MTSHPTTSRKSPCLIEVPMPIRTPRLLIKPREIGEGETIHRAVTKSLEQLKPWMPWAHAQQSVEESEALCRASVADFVVRKDFVLSIYDPTGRELIGSTGIHRPNWKIPSFMIGYWVNLEYAGKGYITEAVNALTRYCFDVFLANRVYLTCDSENVRSIALMVRLGFKPEGLLRNDSLDANGQLRDTCIYARYDKQGLPDLRVVWGSEER